MDFTFEVKYDKTNMTYRPNVDYIIKLLGYNNREFESYFPRIIVQKSRHSEPLL